MTDTQTKLINSALEKLGEHFDAVQIFVSYASEEAHKVTAHAAFGIGSYFARYGQVREWLLAMDEITCCEARNNAKTDGDA